MRFILNIRNAVRFFKDWRHEQKHQYHQIMSAISDFAAAQAVFNDRMDTAITGLQGDVANLNEQIAALQASAGTITPEDQALLDGIQTRAQAITDKLEALDSLTAPVPPTA
jgi:capsule polysaccharide export protein KpsE/RkpR